MPESQNIEHKESWKDEYLKWVCGFANAEEYLKGKELKEALISIVLDTLNNGSINNTRVQELCKVSKATATRYLSDLDGEYIERIGKTGEGTYYKLKGS